MESTESLSTLGHLGIGTRIRRLYELLMQEGSQVYEAAGIAFEPRWFPVFQLALRSPGISISQCAQCVGVSHVAIIKVVGELERAGLLVRSKSASDCRRTELHVTRSGEQTAKRLEVVWQSMEDAYKTISKRSGVQIMATLDKLEAAFSKQAFKYCALSGLNESLTRKGR